MPRRSTKRGGGAHRPERRLRRDRLRSELCGARHRARPELDRRPRCCCWTATTIGERQTSACAAPTEWLEVLGLEGSIRQTFERLVLHTPHGTVRFPLPWTFSTFDYRTLCELLDEQNDAEFETAKVEGRAPAGPGLVSVSTDRGEVTAPLVVDALGWRRVLGADGYQPPDAPLSRGLEVHPGGSSGELEIWIDRSIVPAGYGWSFPAARRGACRSRLVRPALSRQGADGRPGRPAAARRSPLPGQLDPAQAAPCRGRRRLLCGRLRRPLPAADRRRHPDRVLLRHRAGPRAAAGDRRAQRAGRCAAPLRGVFRGARVEVQVDAARAAIRATCAAARTGARLPRHGDAPLHALGVPPLPPDRAPGLRGGRHRRRLDPNTCSRLPDVYLRAWWDTLSVRNTQTIGVLT